MSDLISKSALIDFIEERSGSFGITVANKCNFKEIVKMMKPVDAIDVVRCENCIKFKTYKCPLNGGNMHTDFCSYGERKENE